MPADVQSTRRMAIDPVCQMAVDSEHAAGRLVFHETAYSFCALSCAADFALHPERFVRSP